MFLSLGDNLKSDSESNLQRLVDASIASRVFNQDSSIWGEQAQPEASIRLGWTDPVDKANNLIPEILKLRDELNAKGVSRIVLCGMGGSSLAPEVICKAENKELYVLDSTSPSMVREALQDLEKTAVVVSSKSGSTVETDSQKRIFEEAFEQAGIDPKTRIVIVTDPQSPLMLDSQAKGYTIFEADPNVGGRYSAMTAFGLVPSGLAGANIAKLVSDANSIIPSLSADSRDNPALILASAMSGENSRLVINDSDSELAGFADWTEQLIAESTGKNSRGILPVAGDPKAEIQAKAHKVLPLSISSTAANDLWLHINGSLGEMFMVFETATAAAGWLIGINPFDQPDVESAKKAARESLDAESSTDDFVEISSIRKRISAIEPSGYLSVQLYAHRKPESRLGEIRERFVELTGVPVTIGWGPRFLHSTGQFHKGGTEGGVFLQLVQADEELMIPGKEFGFQKLIEAQASGDAKVLRDKGNTVVRVWVSAGEDVVDVLEKIIG